MNAFLNIKNFIKWKREIKLFIGLLQDYYV